VPFLVLKFFHVTVLLDFTCTTTIHNIRLTRQSYAITICYMVLPPSNETFTFRQQLLDYQQALTAAITDTQRKLKHKLRYLASCIVHIVYQMRETVKIGLHYVVDFNMKPNIWTEAIKNQT